MASLLDRMYAALSNRRLFFIKGWGNLPWLRAACREGFRIKPPRKIEIRWDLEYRTDGLWVRQGAFVSPYSGWGLPEESRIAYVEFILPQRADSAAPVCLHFAATGDEGFGRRRKALAVPLAREGIGSLLLENPYYGRRRPPGQYRKMLNCFSDLCVMGGAVLDEGVALLAWLREAGFSRLGVSGISMGGGMAAQAGLAFGEPLAIIPCIAPHSASAVFTEGILRRYCAWDVLEAELKGECPARDLMREILGLSDIRNYPPPVRPEAAFLVGARGDAYIPPESVLMLHRHWPGSDLQWLDTGHVGAFLFHRGAFLRAIRNAFSRL